MSEANRTAEAQRLLAAHLRDPRGRPPPPDIDDSRLAVYRDLVFNNVQGLLATFFPVTRALHAPAAWESLVRDFLARHRCHSPYFLDIAEEFLQFLETERGADNGDPPFLRDLVHYEWLELVLDVSEDEFPVAGVDAGGDLLAGVPVLSPLVVLAAYPWPVHQVHAGFQPLAPGASPVFLMVYRDRDDQVRFMEVNAAAARLFTLLRERPGLRGEEAATVLAGELGPGHGDGLAAHVRQTLALWRDRHIVAGTRLP